MKRLASQFTLILILLALTTPLTALHAEEKPSKTDADKKSDTAAEPESKAKAPDDVTGGRFAGDPVFVHIAPMNMPVITDQGAEQIVTLLFDVEVKDFDAADNAHTDMPRIRDAIMRALYGQLGSGVIRNGKLVNIAMVKSRATTAVASVIGPDNVRDVLIQGVAQRIF